MPKFYLGVVSSLVQRQADDDRVEILALGRTIIQIEAVGGKFIDLTHQKLYFDSIFLNHD